MNPLELEVAIADRDLWRKRARLAEAESRRKGQLLDMMSEAIRGEGRVVVAVGFDLMTRAIYLQSSEPGSEDDIARRLTDQCAPYIDAIATTARGIR